MTSTLPDKQKAQIQNDSNFYKEITIEGFRQFKLLKTFKLQKLGKINLILGPNNAGKTSLLEAIYCQNCYGNISMILNDLILPKINTTKSNAKLLEVGEQILSLFHKKSSPPLRFVIGMKKNNGIAYSLFFRFQPSRKLMSLDPRNLTFLGSLFEQDNYLGTWEVTSDKGEDISNIYYDLQTYQLTVESKKEKLEFEKMELGIEDPKAVFHDILSHRNSQSTVAIFSYLKRYQLLEKFTQEMSMIFPVIKQIDTIPYPDGSFSPIYIINSNDELLPIYNFGDGMRRWFHLLGNLMIYPNSVHLIEEIDATFHPNAQEKFGHLLVEYAEKFNNQLFMTSHNLEFADKFLESLYGEEGSITEDQDDPVRVITIGQSRDDPEETTVWNLTGRQAYRGRKLYNVELR
jgi:ABC-type lipoprotein export system ATPase subunit